MLCGALLGHRAPDRWISPRCRLFWIWLLFKPGFAVQITMPKSGDREDESARSMLWQTAIGTIPTPCRNAMTAKHHYELPEAATCLPPHGSPEPPCLHITAENQCSPWGTEPLMTLLEESLADEDSQAFFLTATLLETLIEFFEEKHGHPIEPATLQPLHLQDHVRPPAFNLDAESIPLPHDNALLHELFKPWPKTWLLPKDWTCVDLPTTTAAMLPHVHTWEHFLSAGPSQAVSFSVYTDGSATLTKKTSGYANVILAHTPTATFLLGVLGGRLMGNCDSPWVVDCPPALHAEHVAIAVALLWCLQMKGVLHVLHCQICF